jgi:signal transduction histidine kinase
VKKAPDLVEPLLNSIRMSPSAKRDVALLPMFFLFNCFSFSTWPELGQVATKPWLLLVWLYGLVSLAPLAWRNRAPVTVFAIQWAFAVAAWPIFPHYSPVVGTVVALYAVSVHRSRGISLLTLLACFIPNGLCAAVAFRAPNNDPLAAFIANAVFLSLVALGAWGAGRLTQATERYIQELEREREREAVRGAVAAAVAAERRRMARELRDIVSETTGKKAVAELRRLLVVLEASDHPSHAVGIGELRPQPGLDGSDHAPHLTTRDPNAGHRPRRGHAT